MLEFPRWKYVTILLVVLLSVLYALPNLYPSDNSVQITPSRGFAVDQALRQRVETALKKVGVVPKAIDVESDHLLVRLPNADVQTKAADTLRPELGDDYSVALNLASTVPAWLEALHARPMSLGLDLQGGVHFLMQVDQKAALAKTMESYLDSIRVILRDNKVGYTAVNKVDDSHIAVILVSESDAAKARTVIAENLTGTSDGGVAVPGLSAGFSYTTEGKQVKVTLPAAELGRIASNAIEQNRTVIANRVNAIGVAEH